MKIADGCDVERLRHEHSVDPCLAVGRVPISVWNLCRRNGVAVDGKAGKYIPLAAIQGWVHLKIGREIRIVDRCSLAEIYRKREYCGQTGEEGISGSSEDIISIKAALRSRGVGVGNQRIGEGRHRHCG